MGKIVEINAKKKRKKIKKGPLIVLFLIAAIVAFAFSPFFQVEEVEIEGNERVTDEIILDDLDMHNGMNLIRYCVTHYNKEFELDPLVLSADVYIKWPRHVTVMVEEKKVMGYIPYMGMYLCIDTTGSVLDSIHEIAEGTPLLKGITVKSFGLGEPVDTEDTERFTIMLDCLKVLEKYDLLTKTDEISVARSDDIHLTLKEEQLDVSLGTADDLDRKISAVVVILEDEGRPAGTLHLEDMDGQVYIESDD